MRTDIDAIVDLDRYPIRDRETAKALVAQGRRHLAERGLFTLPGFIRPAALARMQAEARALASRAHRHERYRDGVHKGEGVAFPRASRVSVGCAGLDQMAGDSGMRTLYQWDGLTRFVGAVLRREPLYRSADPIVGCMVTVLDAGDELGWHFDPNDGVVSLMLQAPGAGGAFEFAPFVSRGEDGLGSRLEAVMEGRFEGLVRARYAPGTLSLFCGSESLHRVAPVEFAPARMMLLLSYDTRPGQIFEASLRRHFFGRSEPLPQPDAKGS